jgi:hypothetical protein
LFGAAAVSGSAMHHEINIAGQMRARFTAAGSAVVLDAAYAASGRSALLLLVQAAEALLAA